ncbi:MAG: hypothetical protein Q4F00_02730 [bacterium]|nr:hypothetical protein [bacterium]
MFHKLAQVSMNGRMAYTIMCVEAFLVNQYPDRDWHLIAEKMWAATTTNWGDWPDMYCCYLPEIILPEQDYDRKYFGPYMTQQEFEQLKAFYSGITEGREDDPTDEVNYMLNKPFEMAMVYEGTCIGDGHESFEIIDEAEKVLKDHHIALPDHNLVKFSPSSEFNGWGNDFDGTHLSIILK